MCFVLLFFRITAEPSNHSEKLLCKVVMAARIQLFDEHCYRKKTTSEQQTWPCFQPVARSRSERRDAVRHADVMGWRLLPGRLPADVLPTINNVQLELHPYGVFLSFVSPSASIPAGGENAQYLNN